MSKKNNQHSREVSGHAVLMSLGTLLSRILGFIRDMVIGFVFTRTETDVFFAAFRFPNFFRRFFGEGALTVSFVPVFIESLAQEGEEKARRIQAQNLMNSIYTILLAVVSVFTVLGVVFMEGIVAIVFEPYSFSLIEGKVEMTVFLSRLLFVYLFFVVLYAYYTAIANALKRFFLPALAPAAFNLTIILCVLFLPKEALPYPVWVLAAGVLLGGVFQACMAGFVLIRLKFMPVLKFSHFSKQIRTVVYRFFPAILGVGGFALMGLLNVFFAGWLDEGAHTYIYYGDRLLEFPRSLVAVSMGTALLPALSQFMALKKMDSFLELAARQRDLLLYITLPCALCLFFLGRPMLEVLFQRGKFDAQAVFYTFEVLKIYSVLLVILSLIQVLSSCFFAIKNTRLPALSTGGSLLVHAVIAPFFISLFGLKGLVWATVFSALFQLIFLLIFYPKKIGPFYLRRTGWRFFKMMPLLFIFGLSIHFLFQGGVFIFELIVASSLLSQALALAMALIGAGVLYIYLGIYFHLPQALELKAMLKSKWKPQKSKEMDS